MRADLFGKVGLPVRISKFNHEGYYDPTTYRAFKNIEKDEKRKARFRPLVYICSPYAGGDKEQNIANAQRYCRFAVDSGFLPLAPHLYFPQFMDDSDGRDHNTAMFMNMILMTKCAEVWVFGNNITKGMAAEIRRAKETQKPVRHFSNKCKEVQ